MSIVLSVALVAFILFAIELRKPGRPWPTVSGWWARAAALNFCQVGVVLAAGQLWDPWLDAHRRLPVDPFGATGTAVVGYVVITFVYYWWHRARHEVPFLWRWLHQVHHSPERLEVVASFYKHPFEVLANGLLSSALLYGLVGASPGVATSAVLLTGLAELFYHWNVSTPYWVGFLIQRPESHCVHHERGLHHFNYGDLPLWDALFGTLHNPPNWRGQCGYAPGAERRLGEMLVGREIA